MTPRETDRIECAIRHIKTSVDVDPWAVKIAVDAMKRQIPKKPKAKELLPDEYVVGHVKIYATPCGNCGEYISTTLWEYCPWCGQAIDYGGDEE